MKQGRSFLPTALLTSLGFFIVTTGGRAQTNPAAVTLPATNIVAVEQTASGTLKGTVNPGGTNTTAWFEWGVRLNYGNTTPPFDAGDGTNPVPTSATLSNLNAGWRYHYRLVASNSLGVARGADRVCWSPAISLNGSNPLTNECHTRYFEPARVTATPIAVAATYAYSVVLRSDGTVAQWGGSPGGGSEYGPVSSATNVTAIASSQFYSLALRSNGTVVAWGTNSMGSTGSRSVPPSATNVVAIAAGELNALAVRADKTLVGWGFGSTNYPVDATNIVAVAVGNTHYLAMREDGSVIAWGSNAYGQTNVPPNATNVVAIAAGFYQSMALKSDGTVVNWGQNSGAIPDGATNGVAIATSGNHSLVLRADGSVVAWGLNSSGQTNVPSNVTNAVAIAAGYSYSMAVNADGTVIGWGANIGGAISIPSNTTTIAVAAGAVALQSWRLDPNGVVTVSPQYNSPLVSNTIAMDAEGQQGVALKKDGSAVGWGVAVPASMTNIAAVAVGGYHSLALRTNGTVFSWGSDISGSTVIPASATNNVIAIAAGGNSSLALKSNRTVIGWGQGGAAPANATNIVSIATGGRHHLAVTASGNVIGWGSNTNGQITIPASATNVMAVAASGDATNGFSLALRSDGTVIGWGANGEGQGSIPAQATKVVSIAAGSLYNGGGIYSSFTRGYGYGLAVREDGSVIGWGNNDFGQSAFPGNPSNLRLNVEVSGTVNTNVPGSYALTYSVTNTEGAICTATRTVVIADTQPPAITLLGANPWMLEEGHPFADAGATSMDLCNGNLTGSILTTGSVNTNVAGNYQLTYSVTDANGNLGTTNRNVIVVTRPVLTVPAQAGDGSFQFMFTNTPGAKFNVLTATNVSLPLSQWTLLAPVTEAPPGEFHFTDATATNRPTSFYQLRWP